MGSSATSRPADLRASEDILTDEPPPPADERRAYGPEPLQFGDLRIPEGNGPFPLAVVFHGGYWQSTYNLTHTGHMCIALAEQGIATWNVEYRCVGVPGGGWPAAREDVRLAVELAQSLPQDPVVLVGHSPVASLPPGRQRAAPLALPRPGLRRARRHRAIGPESAPGRFMAPEDFADGSRRTAPAGRPASRGHHNHAPRRTCPVRDEQALRRGRRRRGRAVTFDEMGHFEPIDPRRRSSNTRSLRSSGSPRLGARRRRRPAPPT
jgi:hypothetical protein